LFNRVLIATGGSDTSLKAVEYVVELKRIHPEAEVRLVSVATSPVDGCDLCPGLLDIPLNFGLDTRMKDEAGSFARQELDRTIALFEQAGVDVSPVLLAGDPGTEIVNYANRNGADQIVIGLGHPGFWGGMFRGSVTKEVVEQATCPVTVIT
jgi:nucleotide-binding universal stress UspA family protein